MDSFLFDQGLNKVESWLYVLYNNVIIVNIFFVQFGSAILDFSIADFLSCLLSDKNGSASLKDTKSIENSQEPNIADSPQYDKRNQKKTFKYGKKHPSNNCNFATYKSPKNQKFQEQEKIEIIFQ